MRNAFFAGAQHLFSSIMTILDAELKAFLAEFSAKNFPTEGQA